MKSKTTGIWFGIAVALAAFIWIYQSYLQPSVPSASHLLPGLHAADVTAIQINPAGALEISAVRTNGGWQLEKPLVYPAQAAAIDALTGALAKLVPATHLLGRNADAEYGFDNPQFSIVIQADGQRRQLIVGHKTAPGDQVFIRVVGLDGVFVTGTDWLRLLPHSADNWRDTSLVRVSDTCDWLVITNGTKVMEFRRDATNHLWRMTRPLSARADNDRLTAALQQLSDARSTQFITNDPRADLSGYGLQPAKLDIWLGEGTNLTAGVSVGNALSDQPKLVYARRDNWNAVVTADQDTFAAWRGAVNDYRDPHLLTLTAPVKEIEVSGVENYVLQENASNTWTLVGKNFPIDTENVQAVLKLLANLRISEFVKDVVTPTDLQSFGLTKPSRKITLLGTAGDTNSVLAQVLFGTTDTNRVFVKLANEEYIYALKPSDVARLPEHGWEFRDRRIWDFSETNIAQVTLQQNGQSRQMTRTGVNQWTLSSGQGMINPPAIEETMHRFGDLRAAGWVGCNITEPARYGLNTNNLSVVIDLKSGGKREVDFGLELPTAHTALAAVTLAGERWAFVFPPVLYQFVTSYLTIPAKSP